jgi:hypothetical protein
VQSETVTFPPCVIVQRFDAIFIDLRINIVGMREVYRQIYAILERTIVALFSQYPRSVGAASASSSSSTGPRESSSITFVNISVVCSPTFSACIWSAIRGMLPLNRATTFQETTRYVLGHEHRAVLVLRITLPLDVPIFDGSYDVS